MWACLVGVAIVTERLTHHNMSKNVCETVFKTLFLFHLQFFKLVWSIYMPVAFSDLPLFLVSHAPDSLEKNFSRVSVCRKNAI